MSVFKIGTSFSFSENNYESIPDKDDNRSPLLYKVDIDELALRMREEANLEFVGGKIVAAKFEFPGKPIVFSLVFLAMHPQVVHALLEDIGQWAILLCPEGIVSEDGTVKILNNESELKDSLFNDD